MVWYYLSFGRHGHPLPNATVAASRSIEAHSPRTSRRLPNSRRPTNCFPSSEAVLPSSSGNTSSPPPPRDSPSVYPSSIPTIIEQQRGDSTRYIRLHSLPPSQPSSLLSGLLTERSPSNVSSACRHCPRQLLQLSHPCIAFTRATIEYRRGSKLVHLFCRFCSN